MIVTHLVSSAASRPCPSWQDRRHPLSAEQDRRDSFSKAPASGSGICFSDLQYGGDPDLPSPSAAGSPPASHPAADLRLAKAVTFGVSTKRRAMLVTGLFSMELDGRRIIIVSTTADARSESMKAEGNCFCRSPCGSWRGDAGDERRRRTTLLSSPTPSTHSLTGSCFDLSRNRFISARSIPGLCVSWHAPSSLISTGGTRGRALRGPVWFQVTLSDAEHFQIIRSLCGLVVTAVTGAVPTPRAYHSSDAAPHVQIAAPDERG